MVGASLPVFMSSSPCSPCVFVAALALAGGCEVQEVRLGRRCPEGVERCDGDAIRVQDADAEDASEPPARDAAQASDAAGPTDDAASQGSTDAGVSGVPFEPGRCFAGRYVGSFSAPGYKPAARAILCDSLNLPLGVTQGTWEVTLPETEPLDGVMVVESCMRIVVPPGGGNLQGVEVEVPMELEGTVDCATGELSARVKGAYRALGTCDLGDGQPGWYSLKGDIDGRYDPDSRAFVGDLRFWEVPNREPEITVELGETLSNAGGTGSWRGTSTDPSGAATTDCLADVEFSDFDVMR